MVLRVLLTALMCTGMLLAQGPVCVSISPNPVILGQSSITVTVTDSTGAGFQHWNNCVARSIHQDFPNGAAAGIPLGLCGPWTTAAPYASVTKVFPFTAGLQVGHYYVKVGTRPAAGGPEVLTWAPFDVQVTGDPTLTAQTNLQVGQTWSVDLAAPALPGTPYIVAASYSTNVGFALPTGQLVSLDMNNALFDLTWPVASSAFFGNFFSVTDATGTATGINAYVPNIPSLAYLPVYLQCGLLSTGGGVSLTNVVSACILP